MTKRVLITGAAGFVGRHVYEYLSSLSEALDLICTDITLPKYNSNKKFIEADLSCTNTTEQLIRRVKPDYVVHLAGSFSTSSIEVYKSNVLSTLLLLEAITKYAPKATVVITGSAAEYGKVSEEQLPIDEDCQCSPTAPYGLSKRLATEIAQYYYRVHNVCIIVVRPFQLIGKGVSDKLAPGAFARQLQDIINTNSNIIKVGNINTYRDFLDVTDAAAAIWMLCQKPAGGEIYNLCSGKPTKIADLLKTMITASGSNIQIEVDSKKLRGKAEVSRIFGSHQKITNHCGWQPEKSLAQSIQEMFE